jgi:succinate dehydrogenase / fumarate reductase cytochrome b subunit
VASTPGKVVLFLITLSLFFHLANGIRHLFWDAGAGLETATANRTAWAAFAFALVAAVALWVFLAAPLSAG